MKRDLDLVRKILSTIESSNSDLANCTNMKGYADNVILYHLRLLKEAKLITSYTLGVMTMDCKTLKMDMNQSFAHGLTWDGHEFLDNARNDNLWTQAKKICKDAGFEVVKSVLTELAKRYALRQLGIE